MVSIDCVSVGPAQLGECPVWSTAEQVLYWADIEGRRIHRFDPSSAHTTTQTLDGRPGSFVLTSEQNRLLVAMENQVVVLDWPDGVTVPWLELETGGSLNRLNDGRCDPAGRYVVGSMDADHRSGTATGILHQIDLDGSSVTLRTGVAVSNGLAFDQDRSRMYFADSPTGQVIMWDYDVDTGARSDERVFFDYGELVGKPDGGCVDAEGCYWSACVYGSAVIRITPEGVVDRRIELPVRWPTMPAFGGSDLRTLYVTSLVVPDASADNSTGVPEGSLLAVDAGVTGIPEPVFGGQLPD